MKEEGLSIRIMLTRKIYIIVVLGILYLIITRYLRPTLYYTQQRYQPLISQTTITKHKVARPVKAEEDLRSSNIHNIVNFTKQHQDEVGVVYSGTERTINLPDNHEPYLNRFQRRFASSKARNKKGGYLFFRHMRKAGGTSLRVYFHDVMLYHNITRNVNDFRGVKGGREPPNYQVYYIEHEFIPMDWRCPSVDPRWTESLRIIVLRHPIERHLSEFFFSGSGNKYYPIDKEQLYANKTYTTDMATYLEKAIPKWMKGIGQHRSKDNVEGNFETIFSRHYTDNFQLRALAGCSSPQCLAKKKVTDEQYERVTKYHPNSYNYTKPVPRCTQYYRNEDKPSALFEQCAKPGHVKDECVTLGCDG